MKVYFADLKDNVKLRVWSRENLQSRKKNSQLNVLSRQGTATTAAANQPIISNISTIDSL